MNENNESVVVKVTLPRKIVDEIAIRTAKPIPKALAWLATRYYNDHCKDIQVLNRCARCNEEVTRFLPVSTRKKTIVWMQRAVVDCKVCDPRSSWRRIRDL